MNSKVVYDVKLDDYRATDVEGVGLMRSEPDGKIYRWVRNSTGGALTANRIYCHGVTNTSGYQWDQEIFTLGQSSKGTSINMMAGAAMAAVPDAYFGWVQVYGRVVSGPVEGTTDVAAGDNLKMVSGQTYLVKDVAAGTAPTNKRTAIALAAQAADSVVATNVFVNCL